MIIGIDIDDTITNTQERLDEIAKEKENLNIYNRNKHWFHERYNRSLEEAEKFLTKHIEEIMSTVTLKKDVSHYINKLYDEGNKIYFITSRSYHYSANVPDITLEYLDKHNIKHTDIVFSCKNKADICMKYGIDVFIDDSEEHIKEVSDINIKTIIVDNEYNKHINSKRAFEWVDVYNLIKEYCKED